MRTVCPVHFYTNIGIIIIQNTCILPSNEGHVIHAYYKHRIKIKMGSSDKYSFLNKASTTRKFP